jgi:hypothetical protein
MNPEQTTSTTMAGAGGGNYLFRIIGFSYHVHIYLLSANFAP